MSNKNHEVNNIDFIKEYRVRYRVLYQISLKTNFPFVQKQFKVKTNLNERMTVKGRKIGRERDVGRKEISLEL